MKHLSLAVVILVALGTSAKASTITDLTLFELTVSYTPPSFTASNSFGPLSWVDSSGSFFSALGSSLVSWDGSTGVLGVFDLTNNVTLLSGSIVSFAANGLGSFNLVGLLLQSSPIPGLGNSGDKVQVQINGVSSFAADITSIPEPASLGLMAIGMAAMAARRRLLRRR